MKKLVLSLLLIITLISIPILSAEWKPVKPITVIVPWSAGGSTDLTWRNI